jgi:hypothetical protein
MQAPPKNLPNIRPAKITKRRVLLALLVLFVLYTALMILINVGSTSDEFQDNLPPGVPAQTTP